MQSFFQMLSSDPAWIGTGLRVVHLCGLVLGVGAATLLDLIIARFILMRGISFEHVYIVDFSSKIVTIGLVLLWVSGIGFLFHYGIFEPAKLENPKVWAKIAIVAVLSVNGLLVHYFVLPRIRDQVGKRLLDGLSPFDCSLVLFAGTVSAISWYVPLILGAIPQLNYVVPAEVILSSYALLLIAVNTIIQGAIVIFFRGVTIPAVSERGKLNILRGSFALAIGSVCVSLFVINTVDHGTALVETTGSLADEPKVAMASKETDLAGASPQVDPAAGGHRLELKQWQAGAPRDVVVVAAGQDDEKIVERALEKPHIAPVQALLERDAGAESFASLPSGPTGASPPQLRSGFVGLKSGFVGLWASDARACAARPGTRGEIRTVIGERGARAGPNSCAFKEKKQVGNSEWEMKAVCADGLARWQSTVRLSLSKNKLKWSGQRGTQTYVKCS